MPRKTVASVEADLKRVRQRRDYWAARSSHWRRLAMWSIPCGIFGWMLFGAMTTTFNAMRTYSPPPATVIVKTEDNRPAPMSTKVVGEPTTGTYEVKKTSPARVLASVRIGRGGGCSGTIIKRAGENAWGVSAAHCASRVGDQFTIGNPDGSVSSARWVAIDRSLDLSLFITWSKDVLGSAKVTSVGKPDWSRSTEAIGYPGGSGPKWKRFRYLRTEGHGEAGNRKYFRDRYLFDNRGPGIFSGGDSGGGVFYDGDYFIGVMTHGGPHAASLPQIQKFLTANKGKFKGNSPFS